MTEAVVHRLESVEVDEEHRDERVRVAVRQSGDGLLEKAVGQRVRVVSKAERGFEIGKAIDMVDGVTGASDVLMVTTGDEVLDYLVSEEALDWKNMHDPLYGEKHSCTPILDTETSDGKDVTDHWVIYGAFGRNNNHQVLASKRLVLQPGAEYRMKDPVGSDMICTAGVGTVGTHIAAAPRALKPGDVVAALIDGESTLKTFLMRGSKPYLKAENPKYPDLLPAHEVAKLQGVPVLACRLAHRGPP